MGYPFVSLTVRRPLRGPRLAGTFEEVVMQSYARKVVRFLKSEEGATAVEYAVMVALIVAACITTIGILGTEVNSTFDKVNAAIPN